MFKIYCFAKTLEDFQTEIDALLSLSGQISKYTIELHFRNFEYFSLMLRNRLETVVTRPNFTAQTSKKEICRLCRLFCYLHSLRHFFSTNVNIFYHVFRSNVKSFLSDINWVLVSEINWQVYVKTSDLWTPYSWRSQVKMLSFDLYFFLSSQSSVQYHRNIYLSNYRAYCFGIFYLCNIRWTFWEWVFRSCAVFENEQLCKVKRPLGFSLEITQT